MLANEINRIIKESTKSLLKLMEEFRFQIHDPKEPNFDKVLKDYIDFVNEAKKEFQKSLGGEKTFILQRANIQFFQYISKLF